LLAVFAATLAHPKPKIELPPLPSGFTWQEVPELKAAFLRPNDWFFKREESKGTLAYFIQENIDVNGEFQTGLAINVFRLKKEPAVEKGKNAIDQLAIRKHGEKWAKDVGPFKEFGCLARDTDPSGTTVN
jgi:hypothetical protein